MIDVDWSHAARRDLASAIAYWSDARPDYVAGLLDAAEKASDLLATHPGLGSPVEKSALRKLRVGSPPYLLLYRTTRTRVRIVRVYHERQDWQP